MRTRDALKTLKERLDKHIGQTAQVAFANLVKSDLPAIATAISTIEKIESPLLRHKVDDVVGGRIFTVVAALPALTEEGRDAFIKARKRLKSLIAHMDCTIASQAVCEFIHLARQSRRDDIRDLIATGHPVDSRDEEGYSAMDHLIMKLDENLANWNAIRCLIVFEPRLPRALIDAVEISTLRAELERLFALQEERDLKRTIESELRQTPESRARIGRMRS